MSKEKELVPIIGIDGTNPQEVCTLSDQIIKGAYANADTFPDIPVEKGKFSDSRVLLGDFIVNGIGNTKIKTNASASVLHNMILLLRYMITYYLSAKVLSNLLINQVLNQVI